MKTIPFICVNYNSAGETKKYIKSVSELKGNVNTMVVVVDNSPTRKDFNDLHFFIEKNGYKTDRVVVLRKKNRGYFQGLNDGIEYVLSLGIKATPFVIGNNDIVFSDDFLLQLLRIDIGEKTLVLAPDVVTTQGSHENPHVINRMGWLRKVKYSVYFSNYFLAKCMELIRNTNKRCYKEYDPIRREIHMGIGALYILTPNFFKYFQKLDESVFLYGEEAILSGQIKSVDGKIFYEPSLVCNHNESSTTSKINNKTKYKITQKSYKIYKRFL